MVYQTIPSLIVRHLEFLGEVGGTFFAIINGNAEGCIFECSLC